MDERAVLVERQDAAWQLAPTGRHGPADSGGGDVWLTVIVGRYVDTPLRDVGINRHWGHDASDMCPVFLGMLQTYLAQTNLDAARRKASPVENWMCKLCGPG